MDIITAKNILGDRANWELKNMLKALSTFKILNTEEEAEQLEAVKVLLKFKK